MNLFSSSDYREIVRGLVEDRKKFDKKINFQNLANNIRVQKSHLSKVMSGRTNLSSDQMHLICDYFSLNEAERSYLELLLECEKTGLNSRKSVLRKRIGAIQKEQMNIKNRLETDELSSTDLSNFFKDPLNVIVHACLSVDRYQVDPSLISSELLIPTEKVSSVLQNLVRLGVIDQDEGRWRIKVNSVHLPTDSIEFRNWFASVRLLALNRMQSRISDNAYEFTAVYASDETVFSQMKEKLAQLVEESQKLVTSSDENHVYQLNLDLFRWDT